MASSSTPSVDPLDFFPFRGQYGGSSIGAAFFVAVRSTVPLISYSLLAPRSSTFSAFKHFPGIIPSSPAPAGDTAIPLVPAILPNTLKNTLGLQPYPAIVFLGTILPSVSFTAYNTLWRRERFPMTGQGGSLQVTTQVNLIDIIHSVLYVYTASRNPTWSPLSFRWAPLVFIIGFVLHVWSDHSKYLFRKDPRNKGKVYMGGPWGVVRHPNFLEFTIWRTAFATAAGGWAFGASFFAGFVSLFYATSIPILEGYMKRTYGKQWELVTEKVKWKFIPGVW